MRIERGNLSAGGSKKLLLLIPLVALAVWGIPKLFDEAGISGDPWTFEETLPEVQDDFGDDAKVLSISVIGGRVAYEVISDGTVHVRTYTVESEDVRGPQGVPAQSRERRTDESERPATPEDTAAATASLGDLDANVVAEMWDEIGFPEDGSSAALTGTEWALGTGAKPFDRYLANLDGSNIRRTQTKEDVFGQGQVPPGTTEVDPSIVDPSKNPQVQNLQKIAECMQAAGTNIAAIQKCQATGGQ